jgi:hypothetical protein
LHCIQAAAFYESERWLFFACKPNRLTFPQAKLMKCRWFHVAGDSADWVIGLISGGKSGRVDLSMGIHQKPGAARESVGLQGGPVGACQVGTGFDDDDLVAGAG